MLHRLALRVLPQLHDLVTATPVRRRKRWVMLIPGLVAFGLYRLSASVLPLSDPLVLLVCSGTISLMAAFWAYGKGREIPVTALLREETFSHLAWLGGWIGFVYGIQLSLLVLALLKIMVNYDFLLHPDGPAMMAIIIACTSVTRDAFELGHVRRIERQGQAVLTVPDGRPFRQWLRVEPMLCGRWIGVSAVSAGLSAGLAGWTIGSWASTHNEWMQVLLISALIACFGLAAFFAGESRSGTWWDRLRTSGWRSALRLWVWPCLTFAATYYLVLLGAVYFLFRAEAVTLSLQVWIGGMTASFLVGYCLYLGRRTLFETQIGQGVSDGVQRCPFVMGILEKTRVAHSVRVTPVATVPNRPDNAP